MPLIILPAAPEEKDSAGILGGAAMGAEDRTLPEV